MYEKRQIDRRSFWKSQINLEYKSKIDLVKMTKAKNTINETESLHIYDKYVNEHFPSVTI